MALPIAHAAAGYLIHRYDRRRAAFRGWPRALAFMAIGNLPDADFLVGFVLGQPGAFHRGISHTVLAGIIFGLVCGGLSRWWWRDRWLPAALVFAAAYGSHLLVDALTIDARGEAGAQFLWPLSDAYYISPVTIFGEILIDGRSRTGFLATVLAWPTVGVLAREALLALAAVTTCNAIEAWQTRRVEEPALAMGVEEEDLA